MAKATAKTKETVRSVVEEVPAGVTLELTDFEAVALRTVVGSVGGDQPSRHAITRIFGALEDAGYSKYKNTAVKEAVEHVCGGLYFEGTL